VDKAPAQVWARLLDDGVYLCSQSTMYRILRESGESRERRPHATHPPRIKPELVAHAPARCIPGISPSCGVGWMVAETEAAELATEFNR
jgi:hypothetical protein